MNSVPEELRSKRTIRDLLETASRIYEDHPYMCYEGKDGVTEISYRDFLTVVRKVSSCIVNKYGQKKIIVIPGNSSLAWVMAFFGILYSGSIAVPMDLASGDADSLKRIRKLSPDVILTDGMFPSAGEKIKAAFPEIDVMSVESWYEAVSADLANAAEFEYTDAQSPEDTAVLVFTSGTTGDNKIVELTHRNICAGGLLSGTYLDPMHKVGARVFSALPVSHVYGICPTIIGSFYRGTSSCIGSGVWNIKKDLQMFSPEIIQVVPLMINKLAAKLLPAPGTQLPPGAMEKLIPMVKQFFGGNLKTIICGGAPIDYELSKYFDLIGIFLMNGYGITECSPLVCVDVQWLHKFGSVGKASLAPELCSVKIVDREIWTKGEVVSPGYWKEPELNKMVYEDGWFRTGDYGVIDEDGFLFITGRKKNILVLSDGNNISLDELEARICECPEVDSAIVLGSVVKDNTVLEAVVYAVPDNGKTPEENEEAVQNWIDGMNKSNPRYKRIAGYRMTKEPFERTSVGKIKKYKYEAKD